MKNEKSGLLVLIVISFILIFFICSCGMSEFEKDAVRTGVEGSGEEDRAENILDKITGKTTEKTSPENNQDIEYQIFNYNHYYLNVEVPNDWIFKDVAGGLLFYNMDGTKAILFTPFTNKDWELQPDLDFPETKEDLKNSMDFALNDIKRNLQGLLPFVGKLSSIGEVEASDFIDNSSSSFAYIVKTTCITSERDNDGGVFNRLE